LNTKKTYLIFLFSLFIWSNFIFGQDVHFSQFNFSPLNLNPAQTGYFEGQYRLIANHKNQWMSVTTPYLSFGASWDAIIKKRKVKNDMFGIGISAIKDQAGDSKFGTTQINTSVSYILALDNRNNHILSFGITGGVSQRSIDYSALYFDNQYNGFYYDANLPHNESFGKTNFLYYDIATGVDYHYIYNRETVFNIGASLWHLNRAKQSLNDNSSIVMDPKLIIYGNFSYLKGTKHLLKPAFYFARQGPYTEILIGGQYNHILSYNRLSYSSLNTGFFYRNKDAIIMMIGMDYKTFKFNISYDINVSGLTAASQFRGGYEISLIYITQAPKKTVHKEIPCPIF